MQTSRLLRDLHERLKRHASDPLPAILPNLPRLGRETNTRPRREELPPVTRFRSRREIAVPERRGAVRCNRSRALWVL